jgi:hypothetical protein
LLLLDLCTIPPRCFGREKDPSGEIYSFFAVKCSTFQPFFLPPNPAPFLPTPSADHATKLLLPTVQWQSNRSSKRLGAMRRNGLQTSEEMAYPGQIVIPLLRQAGCCCCMAAVAAAPRRNSLHSTFIHLHTCGGRQGIRDKAILHTFVVLCALGWHFGGCNADHK